MWTFFAINIPHILLTIIARINSLLVSTHDVETRVLIEQQNELKLEFEKEYEDPDCLNSKSNISFLSYNTYLTIRSLKEYGFLNL